MGIIHIRGSTQIRSDIPYKDRSLMEDYVMLWAKEEYRHDRLRKGIFTYIASCIIQDNFEVLKLIKELDKEKNNGNS